ncbi:TfoX/Sxy family protein [Frigidibacter sp. RF13]|uniref:TfoX/Sxy family protein n=1 Tax=Frigidibacter sp. RF13 TaxID=2997340 RepID=UPI002271B2DB|nr:TfoX/Sxy family protein [Frigidibacter sp. RF13]MCY1128600.1 TfoX/Sxy family protein [Frigidibacter sp. RF13]
MASPVSSIPNLGPASESAFARAGIRSAEEIRAMGADAAYLRLLQTGTQPHFIGYYVLVMGLQGRPWNDCKGKEKADLRVKFDALKAEAAARPNETGDLHRLEKVLNEIGLRPRA